MTLTQEQMDAVERVRRIVAGESIYLVYDGYDEQADFNRDVGTVALVSLPGAELLSNRKQPGCAGEEGA